jgi:hypothetical protein
MTLGETYCAMMTQPLFVMVMWTELPVETGFGTLRQPDESLRETRKPQVWWVTGWGKKH